MAVVVRLGLAGRSAVTLGWALMMAGGAGAPDCPAWLVRPLLLGAAVLAIKGCQGVNRAWTGRLAG